MAIYFNASAPKGWGVDETGHFIQIPAGYTQQGNQFVAPGTQAPQQQAAPQPQQQQPQTQQSSPTSAPAGLTKIDIPQVWNGNAGANGMYLDSPDAPLIMKTYDNIQYVNGVAYGVKKPDADVLLAQMKGDRIQTYADGSAYDMTTGQVIQQPRTAGGTTGYPSMTGSQSVSPGNIMVSRGSEPPIQVSQEAFNTIYKPAGFNQVQQNQQQGGSAGGTGGSSPQVDVSAMRQQLQNLGINMTGMSDQQIQTLGMMNQIITANATNDKQIAPKSLSQGDLDSFFSQAQSQIDPAYQDQFASFKSDLYQNLSNIYGGFTDAQTQQERAFKDQKDQLAGQMAETGLAQSGIRQNAEAQLKQQQQGVVASNRRQLQQQVYSLGSQAEKLYGSQSAGLIQPYTDKGSAAAGVASATVNYNPIGVKYPQMPQQESTDIINRQTQLAQQELAKRNFQSTGTYTAL